MKKWSGVLLGIILFVTFGITIFGAMAYRDTYIAVWVAPLIALFVAGALSPFIGTRWRRLTGFQRDWLNVLTHFIVVGCFVFGAFLSFNYMFAREASEEAIEAHVVRKYSEQHTRYRRSGRRMRIPDGHYTTWHVDVELPDGRISKRAVDFSRYRRIRVGAPYRLHVRSGLFGFKVIRS